jgi:hypothetical protein
MERAPLAVEQDAAQVQHQFGAFSAPAHPRAVQPQADEIAHCTLDGPCVDVEVVCAELFRYFDIELLRKLGGELRPCSGALELLAELKKLPT